MTTEDFCMTRDFSAFLYKVHHENIPEFFFFLEDYETLPQILFSEKILDQ